MGSGADSLLLIAIGISIPILVAVVLVWEQERRRSFTRLKMGRLHQDNRGLKLALNAAPTGALPATFNNEAERQEFLELAGQLAANGTLLDWLRLGVRPPLDAGARLLGVGEEDAVALRQAVNDWTAQGILAVLDRVQARFTSIADMERVWTTHAGAHEEELRPVLDQAMWVFEPDLVVSGNPTAVTASSSLARSVTDLSLDPGRTGQEAGGKLLVEMRHVRATVGSEDQLAAWNSVRDLMKAGAIKEKDSVEVYVMGGTVDDLDGNPRVEGRNRNVRITSINYAQMIGRAKRLTLGLYDDLKEAPFLRQYRADVAAAAEEAAAAEAAAVAEAAAAAEEAERLQASAHDHHDEHAEEAHGDHHDDEHAEDHDGHDDHAAHPEPHHATAKPATAPAHVKDVHAHPPVQHAASTKPTMKSTRFRNAAQ